MDNIKILIGNYFVVNVPEDAHEFEIDGELFYKASFLGKQNIMQMKKLPSGQWEIIGKGDILSEEQWKGIVEYYPTTMTLYRDYSQQVFGDDVFFTAKESGYSLLKSRGMKPENSLILLKH